MTETRTSEFDDNNNPKETIRVTEELKDEFSGLPSAGVEDELSGLPSFGGKDDKGGILGDGFAKKGRKNWRICEPGRLGDPLVVLGSDIMLMILSCLDARSVALCLLVSCGWRAVASSDKIWSSKYFAMASSFLLFCSPPASKYFSSSRGLRVDQKQPLCLSKIGIRSSRDISSWFVGKMINC